MSKDFDFIDLNIPSIHSELILMLEQLTGETMYPGDERRIQVEVFIQIIIHFFAVINDTAKQKMLRYARGIVLDALGERVNTPRIEAKKSTAVERFYSSSDNLNSSIIIPEGTRVTPDGEIYFITSKIRTISPGEKHVDIDIASEEGGVKYNNLGIGRINRLVEQIPFIERVENITISAGGHSGEPYDTDGDNHYRERIRLAPTRYSTTGPRDAYKYFALSAHPDIINVSVFTPKPGHVTLIPLVIGGKLAPEEIISEVYKVCNDETVRPLTDYLTVTNPNVIKYAIEFKYYVKAEDENEVVKNVESIDGAIEEYLTWQNGQIGRDINPDQLRRFVLNPGQGKGKGALRLDVIEPNFNVLGRDEMANWNGVLNVSHEVTEE